MAELRYVMARDIKPDLDAGLVDGLLGSTSLSVWYGDSGAGKTFVAIDLGGHVGTGRKWRSFDVERGLVVYVAAENPQSVQNRVWAWMQHHRVSDVQLAVVVSPVNLMKQDARRLIELIESMEEPPKLVIIDTLARAMRGDENSSEDMGLFVVACEKIRDRFKCHVLVIHHTGKDQSRGARGSSALRAAVDTEVELVKHSKGKRSFTITKARDGEFEGEPYGYELIDVPLGTNSKGRATKTAVAIEADPPEPKAKRTKLGAVQQIVLDALRGRMPLEAWCKAAMAQLSGDRPKQAFDRAQNALVAAGEVVIEDGIARRWNTL